MWAFTGELTKNQSLTGLNGEVTIKTNIPSLVKGKVFPYSFPSVGSNVDPGVQAVNLQVTISHPSGVRLPLLSARPADYLSSRRASPLICRYQIILLGDRGRCV